MHEWMTDNGLTPHAVVDAGIEGVQVPRAYVKDGKIVLNVSYEATSALLIKNDWITFGARFGGVAHEVRLPLACVLGIYARETGQGMVFNEDDFPPSGEPTPTPVPPAPSSSPSGDEQPKRPRLTVVK
jgi:stringent starvation protein B